MKIKNFAQSLILVFPLAAAADNATTTVSDLQSFLGLSPSDSQIAPKPLSLTGENPSSPGSFCQAKILMDGGPQGQIHLAVESDGEKRVVIDIDPATTPDEYSVDRANGKITLSTSAQIGYYALPPPTVVKSKSKLNITHKSCGPLDALFFSVEKTTTPGSVTCHPMELQTLAMGRTNVEIVIDPETKALKAVALTGIFPNGKKNKPVTVVCAAPQAHHAADPAHTEDVQGKILPAGH